MQDTMYKIEKLRRELEELIRTKGTTDDLEVITTSRELDEIVNEYHQGLKRMAKMRRQRLNRLLDKR